MAPRVHPDRAADGPRDAHRPLEARQGAGRRAAGEHGERRRAPGADVGADHVDRCKRVAELDREPAETRVGDQEVRPPADDEHRHRRSSHGPAGQLEVGRPVDLEEQLGRATDAVGREQPERDAASCPPPKDRRSVLHRMSIGRRPIPLSGTRTGGRKGWGPPAERQRSRAGRGPT